jgi:hypothetical protein
MVIPTMSSTKVKAHFELKVKSLKLKVLTLTLTLSPTREGKANFFPSPSKGEGWGEVWKKVLLHFDCPGIESGMTLF